MRKVVDTSGLRKDILKNFLTSSLRNEVLLTEETHIEITKGDSAQNLRQSMGILAEFPNQVLFLKQPQEIFKLRPNLDGVQERLIDRKRTENFRTNAVFNLARQGLDQQIVDSKIRTDAVKAYPRIQLAKDSAPGLKSSLIEKVSEFTPDEIKAFRADEIMPGTLRRIHRRSLALCNTPPPIVEWTPGEWEQAAASLQYRIGLTIEGMAIDWAVTGGMECRSETQWANDMLDMWPIALGTYFDGIIAEDKRVKRSFVWTMRILAERLSNVNFLSS